MACVDRVERESEGVLSVVFVRGKNELLLPPQTNKRTFLILAYLSKLVIQWSRLDSYCLTNNTIGLGTTSNFRARFTYF